MNDTDLEQLDAWWRACNYIAAGMIYLQDNPLLKEPLQAGHIKNRLLGHWGSSPGLSFCYAHLNRIILERDLNMIFLAGPGHGAPGVLAPCYLEGTYTERYTHITRDADGLKQFFKQFSFPGGVGSHMTPEAPGSIHEGGELGYSLSHGFGAVLDNPDLIAAVVVGDGEAETGPLATAWHSNKFINPARDGAVLPILHLNGYKIANPTLLSRISHEELQHLFLGYGYEPLFVEGNDPRLMHGKMAEALDQAVDSILQIRQQARRQDNPSRPRWPMIVLRSPKGWTGPSMVDNHQVEGSWRAHQVPIGNIDTESLVLLENWLRSYRPEELFDERGTLISSLQALAPAADRRMSANPVTNGGMCRQALHLPDFQKPCYAVEVTKPGTGAVSNTRVLGRWLRDVMAANMQNFRVFGPDETASNRLQDIYDVTGKTWMADIIEQDADGGHLSPTGRVMEILSEHTLQGWLEGYLLTGRHGLFHTYEAFAHVVGSMFNQHAKWLDVCQREARWREPVSSLNIMLSSLVWRQDHNGFSHQDPGYIDLVTNKSASVTRIYFPPDANCLLSVADHCLRSTNYINVIVADKQKHLQYLDLDQAIAHCSKGIGIWDWASTDGDAPGGKTDIVMACCGAVATQESLAAVAILQKSLPALAVRFINVVDLFRLQSDTEHSHGLSSRAFNALFTPDKPIIFNFHGYPWLIHKLMYRHVLTDRLHVRGYKEQGNINTPLQLAMLNQVDRFSLVIDVIDRVPDSGAHAAHLLEKMRNAIIDHDQFAREHGIDRPEISGWQWPDGDD